ncbi:hypothetical protein, partial [Evtepia sp.]|uniref:hypothetical protein n=1 Tax=Evtepia sp. TaxID=2773933 RepID=UPI003F145703
TWRVSQRGGRFVNRPYDLRGINHQRRRANPRRMPVPYMGSLGTLRSFFDKLKDTILTKKGFFG